MSENLRAAAFFKLFILPAFKALARTLHLTREQRAAALRGGPTGKALSAALVGICSAMFAAQSALAQWSVTGNDIYSTNTGNLGAGAPPAAWGTPFKVLQLGNVSFGAGASSVAEIWGNLYHDGTNFRYLSAGTGTFHAHNAAGDYMWLTAPSGSGGAVAPATLAMILSNLGSLGIGIGTPADKLEVNGAIGAEGAWVGAGGRPGVFLSYESSVGYLRSVQNGVGFKSFHIQAADIAFDIGSTTKFSVNSSGNPVVANYTTAGVVTNNSSGILASTRGYTTSIIYAADYGVVANTGAMMTTQVQAAVNAACTAPANRVLQFPGGDIDLDGTITISEACRITGTDSATQHYVMTAAPNAGTRFIQHTNNIDTFYAPVWNGPLFENFTCVAPRTGPPTTGACIHVSTPNLTMAASSLGLTIRNVQTNGGYYGIHCQECGNAVFERNIMWAAKGAGFFADNILVAPDSGDNSFNNNRFYPDGVASNNALYLRGGGWMVYGNKFLGSDISIHVEACHGRTGTVIIEGNSIEEAGVNQIRVTNCNDGISFYGNIVINGNQLQNLNTPGFQSSIAFILNGDAPYINYFVITNNQINNGLNGTPTFAAACMDIEDGVFGIIANNLCNQNNVPGYSGIHVVGNASNVQVVDNQLVFTPGGRYLLTKPTLLRDLSGMTVANSVGLNVTNGSQIYFSDGNPTTYPCTGGNTSGGSMGFAQNGFKCF